MNEKKWPSDKVEKVHIDKLIPYARNSRTHSEEQVSQIAAEKHNIQAFIMELDPKYSDVIIKRWCDFTGKDAINEATGEKFPTIKGE